MAVDIHKGRLHSAGRIATLYAILDKSNGKVVRRKPRHVGSGSLALVSIDIIGDSGIPIESGNRVVLRSNGETVAAGIVE